MITIEESQQLRKDGYTIVVNRTLTKVLLATKNEDDAYDFKKECLLKNKVVKVFCPLIKIEWNKADHEQAMRELSLGLNFR